MVRLAFETDTVVAGRSSGRRWSREGAQECLEIGLWQIGWRGGLLHLRNTLEAKSVDLVTNWFRVLECW